MDIRLAIAQAVDSNWKEYELDKNKFALEKSSLLLRTLQELNMIEDRIINTDRSKGN